MQTAWHYDSNIRSLLDGVQPQWLRALLLRCQDHRKQTVPHNTVSICVLKRVNTYSDNETTILLRGLHGDRCSDVEIAVVLLAICFLLHWQVCRRSPFDELSV